MRFIEGERVWWQVTAATKMHGTVRELDTNTTVGVQPDGETGLLYLDLKQLHHEGDGQ